MSQLKRYFILLLLLTSVTISCTSKKKIIDDDFATDTAEAGLTDADLTLDDPATDEFAEFENGDQNSNQDDGSDLEKELNAMSNSDSAPSAPGSPDVPVVVEAPTETVVDTPPAPEIVEVSPAPTESTPEVTPTPEVTYQEPAVNEPVAQISKIEFKGNNNGGAFIVSSDHPLRYTTRTNASSNQIVVEVENAVINPKYTRALNTKDMGSSIDFINIYQKSGSKTARFVIQLRQGAPEPLVQPEGNSLLIVGSPMGVQSQGVLAQNNNFSNSQTTDNQNTNSAVHEESQVAAENEVVTKGILSSDDLEDFLSNNKKYYGSKISLETTSMDVRDILKFLSEQSGVNMVFDDDVSGPASLKLRKVPWDQALITLLKSKKLGYRRQGNILRISKYETLLKEDEAAIKLKESRATIEPLVVKNFAINYADIADLSGKIEKYISENKGGPLAMGPTQGRGRVTGDLRTNTLIVSETPAKMKEIEQLIKALDTQPQQVMIESRIVEAASDYTRNIGASFGLNRKTITSTSVLPGQINQMGATNISPSLGYNSPIKGGGFVADLVFGTLGAFGNLDAQLQLDETEKKIKIISSPKVAVLTNTAATLSQGVTYMIKSELPTPTGPAVTYTPVQADVQLKVTPTISNMGTVRLKLNVSRKSLRDTVTGATDNRNVETEVIVKNGDTAVIGGVFTADVNEQVSGVPGLKDIPILGTLFKGESKFNAKNELMIFVTPRIIPLLNHTLKAENGADQF